MDNVFETLDVLAGGLPRSACVAPECSSLRAETALHEGSRYCERHLVLSLRAERKVLTSTLRESEAKRRNLEHENEVLLEALVDRDPLVAALVREKERAVRELEEERRRRR